MQMGLYHSLGLNFRRPEGDGSLVLSGSCRPAGDAILLSNKDRRTDIHEVLVEPALENPIY